MQIPGLCLKLVALSTFTAPHQPQSSPLEMGGGPESNLIPPALPHPPSPPPAPPLPSLSAVTETELLTPVGVSIGLDFTSSAPTPPILLPV